MNTPAALILTPGPTRRVSHATARGGQGYKRMSENDTKPTRTSRPARAPQDRRPRAVRAPRPVPVEPVADDATDGPMSPEDWIPATICGETVWVAPISQWRMSANDALVQGRINDWACKVMDDVDAATWLRLDPTNAQAQVFFAEWTERMLEVATPSDREALAAFLRRR